MQKWEYKIIIKDRETSILGQGQGYKPNFSWDDLGNEGWELVAVVPISAKSGEAYAGLATSINYYFKRPLE